MGRQFTQRDLDLDNLLSMRAFLMEAMDRTRTAMQLKGQIVAQRPGWQGWPITDPLVGLGLYLDEVQARIDHLDSQD